MIEKRIYELARYFVYELVTNKTPKQQENMMMKVEREIPQLLQEGWTFEGLSKAMYETAKMHPTSAQNAFHIRELLGKIKPPSNLIDPDEFYYHNELRVEQEQIRKRVVDGQLVVVNDQPFRLEIKSYYSEQDLINYFYKKIKMPKRSSSERRDFARLKHLLEQYDVDTILFAIDIYVAVKSASGRVRDNLFDVQDFTPQAEDAIAKKRNQHRLLGINKEVF